MRLSRPSRRIAALIALFSMLFTQLAVASYVCPGMAGGGSVHDRMGAMSVESGHSAMPGCKVLDQDQPGLCHAHAQNQSDKQSLDKPQLPDIQSFVSVGPGLAVYAINMAARPQQPPPDSLFLTRSTAPPLAIRNCCFRI